MIYVVRSSSTKMIEDLLQRYPKILKFAANLYRSVFTEWCRHDERQTLTMSMRNCWRGGRDLSGATKLDAELLRFSRSDMGYAGGNFRLFFIFPPDKV